MKISLSPDKLTILGLLSSTSDLLLWNKPTRCISVLGPFFMIIVFNKVVNFDSSLSIFFLCCLLLLCLLLYYRLLWLLYKLLLMCYHQCCLLVHVAATSSTSVSPPHLHLCRYCFLLFSYDSLSMSSLRVTIWCTGVVTVKFRICTLSVRTESWYVGTYQVLKKKVCKKINKLLSLDPVLPCIDQCWSYTDEYQSCTRCTVSHRPWTAQYWSVYR